MIIKFILISVLYILINSKYVYSKEYPLEQYYIIHRNFYDRHRSNVQPNPDLITETVYSGSLYNKIRLLNKTEPNYKEEITKLLYNGKTVDFGNYFTKDPFNVFLDARAVSRNVLLNFTITFGEEIISKRRKDKNRTYQLFNPYYQDENEKDIIDMYKYMLTTGNENIDFDEILDKDINIYTHIERSLNMDYAISSLSNQNVLNWILYGINNPVISALYNNYGNNVNSDNFLNLTIETLITDHPNIGLMLDSKEKFNEFKSIIETMFTNYSFPNNFEVYIASNNTDTSNTLLGNISSDVNICLYNLYLKLKNFVNNSGNSIIDLVLQELLIRNIEASGFKNKNDIERKEFLQSVTEIVDIYKDVTELLNDITLTRSLNDNIIAEHLLAASYISKPDIIGNFVNLNEGHEKDLENLILNYDIVIKYFENISDEYYNRLIEDANSYINLYSTLNLDNRFNRFVYRDVDSNGGFINEGLIVPYSVKMNKNNYYSDIIYAIYLIKQDLNSMFQMGDTLIYGYERAICFEVDNQSGNELFITNKIDKDCIYKGSRAANEAIYKITKIYYDTFITNCQDDIKNLNSTSTTDIIENYLLYDIISSEQFLQLKLPTIKMYKNMNFEKVNEIFNSIYNEHSDSYISAASNLIKKMGLYMVDINLLSENLDIEDEEVDESFKLTDIELPKSKMLENEGLISDNISWGSDIIDIDYSNYFDYQYFSLSYYIEDLGENVRNDDKLDKTIIKIKELSKNIIQKVEYYGNIFLLNNLIEKYESMVDIITEYIYQYGIGYIDVESYVPDDMTADEYAKLVDIYNNYLDKLDIISSNSLQSLLLNIQINNLESYKSDILNYSNEIRNSLLEQSDGYSLKKRTISPNLWVGFGLMGVGGGSRVAIELYVNKAAEKDPTIDKEKLTNSLMARFTSTVGACNFLKFVGVDDATAGEIFGNIGTSIVGYQLGMTFVNSLYTSRSAHRQSTPNEGTVPPTESGIIDIVIEGGEKSNTNINQNDNGKVGPNEEDSKGKGPENDNERDITNESTDGKSTSSSKTSDKFCRGSSVSKPGESSLRKRQSKCRCNKNQIIRDYVYYKDSTKSTLKNSIGKLDSIDPDDGYKELADSVDYTEYLSGEFEDADDFSESSKFGEDSDSPLSLEDISSKMSGDTETLKVNVGTVLSDGNLSKSKKVKKRRPPNRKMNKSPSKVKMPSESKKSV